MTYITTTISREKLRLNEFESDSIVISDPKSTQRINEKEFYAATVDLLALIYSNLNELTEGDL